MLFAQQTHHLQVFTETNQGNVAVFKIYNLICIFYNRTGITAQEELPVADTHHQRTLLASSHNLVGMTLVNNGNGIGANNLIKRHLNGL